MQHQNLSTIIHWYKGRTTFESRKINPEFTWQSRFYDHIIRSENDLNKIREYIKNNLKEYTCK
jgi:REP element-mobilizing transposase RayT